VQGLSVSQEVLGMMRCRVTVNDINPEQDYTVGELCKIRTGRNRELVEALRNDPIAPNPVFQTHNKKLYRGKDIIAYVNGENAGLSDLETIAIKKVNAVLERERENLERERAKLEKEREALHAAINEERNKWTIENLEALKNEVLQCLKLESGRLASGYVGTWAGPGVYFLKDKGEIVYVGQSVMMAGRISQHMADHNKTFNEVMFFKCEKEELDNWEGFFIRLLRPKLNGGINRENPSAPLSSLWMRVEKWKVEMEAMS
jgi:hypothetical protein